jgi:chromosomal replication initiator protein
MGDDKAKRIWESSLGELQLQVPRPSYETWLKGTVGILYDGSTFTVGVPSTFVAECLETRLYSLISRSLERTSQSPVRVLFRVLDKDNSRIIDKSKQIHIRQQHEQKAQNGTLYTAGLNPRYTFQSFVVGDSNSLAHGAALAAAQGEGDSFNPLFIYSDVGLGKTHLLHAIGHLSAQLGRSWLYTSAEQFTNEFITSLQKKKMEEFRARYRGVDVLLVDDIQFMAGKEHSQEAFFHTFNHVHGAVRQLVITSDCPPQSLPHMQSRLRSRFEGGLSVDITPPSFETRLAILRSKAMALGLNVGDEILGLISASFPESVRSLEGILNRVAAVSKTSTLPIPLKLVNSILEDVLLQSHRDPAISPEAVMEKVGSFYNIPLSALRVGRGHSETRARHVAMFLLREDLNRPLVEIGRLLGGKSHATVLHACSRISSSLHPESRLSKDISLLRQRLRSRSAP